MKELIEDIIAYTGFALMVVFVSIIAMSTIDLVRTIEHEVPY